MLSLPPPSQSHQPQPIPDKLTTAPTTHVPSDYSKATSSDLRNFAASFNRRPNNPAAGSPRLSTLLLPPYMNRVTIFVGNISPYSSVANLRKTFSRHCKVLSCSIPGNQQNRRKKFGFVTVESPDAAKKAMQELKGYKEFSCHWIIDFARQTRQFPKASNVDASAANLCPGVESALSFQWCILAISRTDVSRSHLLAQFQEESVNDIEIHSLGSKVFLLSFQSQEHLNSIMPSNWLLKWFYRFFDWAPFRNKGGRFCWLAIHGIPYHLWSEDTIGNLAKLEGALIDINPPSRDGLFMDHAQVLVHTDSLLPIHKLRQISFSGSNFPTLTVECQVSSLHLGAYMFGPSGQIFPGGWPEDSADHQPALGNPSEDNNRFQSAASPPGEVAGNSDISQPTPQFPLVSSHAPI